MAEMQYQPTLETRADENGRTGDVLVSKSRDLTPRS
jgi:hypothetical protein